MHVGNGQSGGHEASVITVERTSIRGYGLACLLGDKVFHTPNKGWGVRSWDYITSGATICEYIGLLKNTDQIDPTTDNYVFDIDCLQTIKGLDGREASVLLFYRPDFHFLFSYVIIQVSRFSRRAPPKLLFSPGLDIRSSCVQIIQLLYSLIVLAVVVFPEIRHRDNSAILPFWLWFLCFVYLSTLFSFVFLWRRLGEVSLPGNWPKDVEKMSDREPEYCIDVVSVGNVSRFINHKA
ncbi:Histone-lysine N-methyltransferase, H3 lysine-9 specific SUVH4 [Capsicum baccatum]|uniref:Histone-lysine N-methyltransferase, H3 lysine-9 specific SUVH4 n=1 Tax=Capsicum baccatum TaxID=33114 RepID=A0A2G2VGS0_CAPBA|nr:Histone-lysine N-methyltransferase, H3 lysine-9 specific SUVH4 [Capsicum baccatum]